MNGRNVAYDLSVFEDKRVKKKVKNNVVRIPRNKVRRRVKTSVAFNFVVVTLIAVVAISATIYGRIQMTELTEKANIASKELDESKSEYTQMEMQIKSKCSLKSVEECAKSQLFMKEIEPSQVEYISLSDGDKGEIKDRGVGDSIFDKLKNMFS